MGKVPGGVQVAAKMWGWDSNIQSQSTPQVNSVPSTTYIYIYIIKNFLKKRERERKDLRGKDTKTFLSRGMPVKFLST